MASAQVTSLAPARPRARRGRARGNAALATFAAVLLLAGAAYLVARETSLFGIRSFDVIGAPENLERSIVSSLARFEGASLVGVSSADVERAVESLPAVRSATVDRDFPHTLRIVVRPERAVAVVRRDGEAWLVATTGRVLERLEPGVLRALPRVWIPSGSGDIQPGDTLLDEQGAIAVRALASLPAGFPVDVASALGDGESLTLVLAGKTELRLGEPLDVRRKLDAAAAVLEALGPTAAGDLAYLDVSLPTRPVGATKSQVDTSA